MEREVTLYKEKSFERFQIQKYIRLRKKEISIFTLFLFLLIVDFIIFIFSNRVDIGIQTILLMIMCIFLYFISLKPYVGLRENIKNPIVVTSKKIVMGKRVFKLNDIKRSVYNVSTGYLYIYLKSGKKFGICKDVSKISHFGGGTHFSYVEYGRALKKLGIPFEVVRKKGLFSTEAIMGKENYDEMNHEERYERWVENKRKKVRKHQKEDITK